MQVENNSSSHDIVSSDIGEKTISKSLLYSFIRLPPSISEKVRRKDVFRGFICNHKGFRAIRIQRSDRPCTKITDIVLFQIIGLCFKHHDAIAACVNRKLYAECNHSFADSRILLVFRQSRVAFWLTLDVGDVDYNASFPDTIGSWAVPRCDEDVRRTYSFQCSSSSAGYAFVQ